MFLLYKSKLFMQQWQDYAQGYKDRAGVLLAERFIVAVEDALNFIQVNPNACTPYFPGEGYADLQAHHFRKWSLKDFPHLVLFRVVEKVISVEALYAHKQDIDARLYVYNDLEPGQ